MFSLLSLRKPTISSDEIITLIQETLHGRLYINSSITTWLFPTSHVIHGSLTGVTYRTRIDVTKRPKDGSFQVLFLMHYPHLEAVPYDNQIHLPVENLTPQVVISEVETIYNDYMKTMEEKLVQLGIS